MWVRGIIFHCSDSLTFCLLTFIFVFLYKLSYTVISYLSISARVTSRSISQNHKSQQVKRSCFPLRPRFSFWNYVHLRPQVTCCHFSLSPWDWGRQQSPRSYLRAHLGGRICGPQSKVIPDLLRNPSASPHGGPGGALIKINSSGPSKTHQMVGSQASSG